MSDSHDQPGPRENTDDATQADMGMGGPPAQSATPVGQGEDDGAGTGDPEDTSDDSSDDGDD